MERISKIQRILNDTCGLHIYDLDPILIFSIINQHCLDDRDRIRFSSTCLKYRVFLFMPYLRMSKYYHLNAFTSLIPSIKRFSTVNRESERWKTCDISLHATNIPSSAIHVILDSKHIVHSRFLSLTRIETCKIFVSSIKTDVIYFPPTLKLLHISPSENVAKQVTPTFVYPSKLSILYYSHLTLPKVIVYPESLEILDIGANVFGSPRSIDLPRGLKTLNLHCIGDFLKNPIRNFKIPLHLVRLDISSIKCSIFKYKLPPTLKILLIGDACIETIQVVLPSNLESLYLGDSYKQSIMAYLPQSIKQLRIPLKYSHVHVILKFCNATLFQGNLYLDTLRFGTKLYNIKSC